MKLLQLLALLFLTFIANVSPSIAQSKIDYDELKQKDFAHLSTAQQNAFKIELIRRLAHDPNLLEIKKQQEAQVQQLVDVAKNRTPEQRKKLKIAGTGLSPTEQFRAMGIKDPEKYANDQMTLITKMAMLISNYPELKKFDVTTRKEILKSATQKAGSKQK